MSSDRSGDAPPAPRWIVDLLDEEAARIRQLKDAAEPLLHYLEDPTFGITKQARQRLCSLIDAIPTGPEADDDVVTQQGAVKHKAIVQYLMSRVVAVSLQQTSKKAVYENNRVKLVEAIESTLRRWSAQAPEGRLDELFRAYEQESRPDRTWISEFGGAKEAAIKLVCDLTEDGFERGTIYRAGLAVRKGDVWPGGLLNALTAAGVSHEIFSVTEYVDGENKNHCQMLVVRPHAFPVPAEPQLGTISMLVTEEPGQQILRTSRSDDVVCDPVLVRLPDPATITRWTIVDPHADEPLRTVDARERLAHDAARKNGRGTNDAPFK